MGNTPLSLRCVKCKVMTYPDTSPGHDLTVLGHEIKLTWRPKVGKPKCHRAIVQCNTCGHIMRSTHPGVAVTARRTNEIV